MSVKDNVADALRRKAPEYISGESLAKELGVSRNAVWKAVTALRGEGYEIDSVTNRGYCLRSFADRLDAREIAEAMQDKSLKIVTFDTIDSTNNEAKRRVSVGEERFFLVADEQTVGRGRSGKSFYSPAGTGIYMTLAIKPKVTLEDAANVTAYAAVCVVDAIREVTGLECGVKWVNDVFLNGKKVCGILTEAVADFESGAVASLVIGIGINLKPTAVPKELENIVGFLNCGDGVKNRLAAAVADRLLKFNPRDKLYMEKYRAYSIVVGREVGYISSGIERRGVAVDISPDGALVVRRNDGVTESLRSGEISLKNIDGIK